MAVSYHRNSREEDSPICTNTVLLMLGLLCVLIGVVLVIIGSVRLHAADENCTRESPSLARRIVSKVGQSCAFSVEAVRVGLPGLLEEVKSSYFEHNPDNIAWMPDLQREEIVEYVKTRCEVDVVHNQCSLGLVGQLIIRGLNLIGLEWAFGEQSQGTVIDFKVLHAVCQIGKMKYRKYYSPHDLWLWKLIDSLVPCWNPIITRCLY